MGHLRNTKTEQSAVTPESLVQIFKENGMRTSARNKAGNVIWPIARKYFQGCMVVGGLLATSALLLGTGTPLAMITAVGAAYGFQRIVNSHIKFLQNMTLSNATLFGRMMKGQNVPEQVRQNAMERFLSEAGPLFTAKGYIKEHPDHLRRLANGETVPKIPTVMGNAESRLNRLDRIAKKNGHVQASFRERFKAWRDAFREARDAAKDYKTLDAQFGRVQQAREEAVRGLAAQLEKMTPENTAQPVNETMTRKVGNITYSQQLVGGERITTSAEEEQFSVSEREIKTKHYKSANYFVPGEKEPIAHSFLSEQHFIDRQTGEKSAVITESESMSDGATLSRTKNTKTGETVFREQHPLSHQEWVFDREERLTSSVDNRFETQNRPGEYRQTDYTYDAKGNLAQSMEKTSVITPESETVTVVHRGPDGKEIPAESLSVAEMAKKSGRLPGRG